MNRPFIVAEIGGNHLGNFKLAQELVAAAARAGADAVKFQCFQPAQMATPFMNTILDGPWAGRDLYDLYRETHTPREWFRALFDYAQALGMVAFSSVFHPDDVDFLETIGCPIYKIASFELTDLALIRHAARTGKPIIISTGMATEDEINAAVAAARPLPSSVLTLLKCTSSYPAPIEEANLATMVDMRDGWKCDGGLSDHTAGHAAAAAASALGATVIEKHLTLLRADGGPDAAFSSEPEEFVQMVKACREAAAAIGTVCYGPTISELPSMPLRRKPGGTRGMR